MLLSSKDHWLNSLVEFPAGIKIGLFLLTWIIIWLPLGVLLGKRIKWRPFQSLSGSQKLPLVLSLYLTTPFVLWLTLRLDRTYLSDYGLSWQPTLFLSLLIGIVMGIGGIGVIFALEGVFGWLNWHRENLPRLGKIFLPLLGLGLWVGITEELIFRGVFFNVLQKDYTLEVAAVISSGIFSLVHLLWEREDTLPQIPGLWLMGMVLVGARLVDGGSIGLAWGLHAGWILGLAALDAAELISYTGKGLDWIIGFRQQPLAGIGGIFCLLGTGFILSQL
ncbi:CPBP family intramembrane glutamic endopeptidase [Aphanothece sacrum]|uniref:Abortive phage infection protein n=1 Tax=Aphanothece sacrum FPU1 TaxID=1920663 RepID=A0A401ILY3_APHSA|nr:CPBP family intramembrane glutamic endopeptidase [Aphanothece sacrum]GBF82233.1 abortive phage infection protein [Aphanothece sacrum FPU1]GBF87229.1 abortive phage infection protein [Aphanothece sacrum FPU3]